MLALFPGNRTPLGGMAVQDPSGVCAVRVVGRCRAQVQVGVPPGEAGPWGRALPGKQLCRGECDVEVLPVQVGWAPPVPVGRATALCPLCCSVQAPRPRTATGKQGADESCLEKTRKTGHCFGQSQGCLGQVLGTVPLSHPRPQEVLEALVQEGSEAAGCGQDHEQQHRGPGHEQWQDLGQQRNERVPPSWTCPTRLAGRWSAWPWWASPRPTGAG